MPTPDSSEYIRIKRLQTVISGDKFSNKPNRIPSYGIRSFPINVLRPAKLIFMGNLALNSIINTILSNPTSTEGANKLYSYLSGTLKSTYDEVLSKLGGPRTLKLSDTEYLVLPSFGSNNVANISHPSMSTPTTNVYIMYPGSSVIINDQNLITIVFDGKNYKSIIDGIVTILKNDMNVPGLPGITFRKGSVALTSTPISPGTFLTQPPLPNPYELVCVLERTISWIHPDIINLTGKTWSLRSSLPLGLYLNSSSGYITGKISTTQELLLNPGRGQTCTITDGTNDFSFSVIIINDLNLKEDSTDEILTTSDTLDISTLKMSKRNVFVPLNADSISRIFQLVPEFQYGRAASYEVAINPPLPAGLVLDTSQRSIKITGQTSQPCSSTHRIDIRDGNYPWLCSSTDYFTLQTIPERVEIPNNIVIYFYIGIRRSVFDLTPYLRISGTPYPTALVRSIRAVSNNSSSFQDFIFFTTRSLTGSIEYMPNSIYSYKSEVVAEELMYEETYIVDIDVFDYYSRKIRPATNPITIIVTNPPPSPTVWSSIQASYIIGLIIYDGGIWLLGDEFGRVAYASNPIGSWTTVAVTDGKITTITYGNGLWVACNINASLFYTDDINIEFMKSDTPVSFYSIHYANGLWVAGDFQGNIWYSSSITGIWMPKNTLLNSNITDIEYANGTWVATDQSRHGIWYTTDPSDSWTFVDMNNAEPRCVKYSNGTWLVGCDNGFLFYTTEPASIWNQIVLEDTSIRALSYVEGTWVVADLNSKIWYTTKIDAEWTPISIPGSYIYAMDYGNNMLVAGDITGKIWYSTIV